jgi:D-aminopeptidase
MRVLIQADMEGVAQITRVQQVVPLWPEYSETGRPHLTDDVIAAATGLLAGGVSEVVVDDQHLGGLDSVIRERLPQAVTMLGPDVIYRQLQEHAFDAVF